MNTIPQSKEIFKDVINKVCKLESAYYNLEKDFLTENEAKTKAYHFILQKGYLKEFKEYCKYYNISEPHKECLKLLAETKRKCKKKKSQTLKISVEKRDSVVLSILQGHILFSRISGNLNSACNASHPSDYAEEFPPENQYGAIGEAIELLGVYDREGIDKNLFWELIYIFNEYLEQYKDDYFIDVANKILDKWKIEIRSYEKSDGILKLEEFVKN